MVPDLIGPSVEIDVIYNVRSEEVDFKLLTHSMVLFVSFSHMRGKIPAFVCLDL